MRSLAILVPLLLVTMVAANGALTVLPQSITGPGLELSDSGILGLGIAGAAAESEAPMPPFEGTQPVDPVFFAVINEGASDSFQLAVPFHTQKDGDRFQGSNCGPASLQMVLDAFGVQESNADLRLLSHTYQGTVGYRGGTALQYVARAARDFGIETVGLYDGPAERFHQWSIEDVRAELAAGRPVVPLVKYRLLPGHEASTIRFDHYIVIYGEDGDQFLYHDPSYEAPSEGSARWIGAPQLNTAMRASIVPGQAVSFGPGQREALAASRV